MTLVSRSVLHVDKQAGLTLEKEASGLEERKKFSLCSMKLCSHRLLFSVHRIRAMSSVAHRLETHYG